METITNALGWSDLVQIEGNQIVRGRLKKNLSYDSEDRHDDFYFNRGHDLYNMTRRVKMYNNKGSNDEV